MALILTDFIPTDDIRTHDIRTHAHLNYDDLNYDTRTHDTAELGGAHLSRSDENTAFRCGRCGADVLPSTDGHYRNHCPQCLWSKHVDVRPGDRASACAGLMEPVGLVDKGGKGWQIVHRCTICTQHQPNRVVRDGASPDDLDMLLELPWL